MERKVEHKSVSRQVEEIKALSEDIFCLLYTSDAADEL